MSYNARRFREFLAHEEADQAQREYTWLEWSAEHDDDEDDRERARQQLDAMEVGE